MEDLAPVLAVAGMFFAIGWMVKIVSNNRRMWKFANLQAEMQAKVLEKLEGSQQIGEYLQSDAGQRLLESANIEPANPYGKILGSIQAGVILTLVGAAVLYLRGQIPEAQEAFAFLGAVGVALGFGFVISAGVAWMLSKSWGLINGDGE
jgi:hypothetical protein